MISNSRYEYVWISIELRPAEDEAKDCVLVRPRENTAWVSVLFDMRLEQQLSQAR